MHAGMQCDSRSRSVITHNDARHDQHKRQNINDYRHQTYLLDCHIEWVDMRETLAVYEKVTAGRMSVDQVRRSRFTQVNPRQPMASASMSPSREGKELRAGKYACI